MTNCPNKPQIKPLEWEVYIPFEGAEEYGCSLMDEGLIYSIFKYPDGNSYHLYINSRFEEEAPDLESAKAHAQSYFEAEIRAYLMEESTHDDNSLL